MYGRFSNGVSKVVVITLFVAFPFLLWLIWGDPHRIRLPLFLQSTESF